MFYINCLNLLVKRGDYIPVRPNQAGIVGYVLINMFFIFSSFNFKSIDASLADFLGGSQLTGFNLIKKTIRLK